MNETWLADLRKMEFEEDGNLNSVLEPRHSTLVAQHIGLRAFGAALPIPSTTDQLNRSEGLRHRVLKRMGRDDWTWGEKKRLRNFVRKWIFFHLPKICELNDLEGWLATRQNYSESRKDQIRLAHMRVTTASEAYLRKRYSKVVAHVKVEEYDDWKPPRGIYARVDEFKSLYGPWVHMMEDVVFDKELTHNFCKHRSYSEVPQHVQEWLGGYKYHYVSDYSRFEACVTPTVMKLVENELYKYFGVPHVFYDIISGVNRISMKRRKCEITNVKATVIGKRMSGEMNTSLSNGFTNLMLLKFAIQEEGLEGDAVVEGDDGIIGTNGPFEAKFIKKGPIALKMEAVRDLGRAGFLQGYWTQAGDRMLSPKMLLKSEWTFTNRFINNEKVKQALYAAKVMSFHYCAPRCPIVWKMVEDYLRAKPVVSFARYKQDYHTVQKLQNLGIEFTENSRGLSAKVQFPGHTASLPDDIWCEYESMFDITREQVCDDDSYQLWCENHVPAAIACFDDYVVYKIKSGAGFIPKFLLNVLQDLGSNDLISENVT